MPELPPHTDACTLVYLPLPQHTGSAGLHQAWGGSGPLLLASYASLPVAGGAQAPAASVALGLGRAASMPAAALLQVASAPQAPLPPLQMQRSASAQSSLQPAPPLVRPAGSPPPPPPASPPPGGDGAALAKWYRAHCGHLAALVMGGDDGGSAAAADALLEALHALAARRGGAFLALAALNLDTARAGSASDAHWRAALSELALSPEQRARVLACAEAHARRREGAAAALRSLRRELEQLADGTAAAPAYHSLCARLRAALASEVAALLVLASAVRRVLAPAQLARWAVVSWPFLPSPDGLAAAIAAEAAGARAAPAMAAAAAAQQPPVAPPPPHLPRPGAAAGGGGGSGAAAGAPQGWRFS